MDNNLLKDHFGFREFLEGQEAVVNSIVNGNDSLVIMPTGGGKSLCYQLPALVLEGITLVVSPLIALMKDQVDSLAAKKIPATFINSTLSTSEMNDRMHRMALGEYRLVYVAPERFKSERFMQTLTPLSISLFAIDEAHCISQWGHDFRPDYLRLKWVLKELGQPQVAALTATATPEVRKDIIEQLGLGKFGREEPQVFVTGFARHNLTLGVTQTKDQKEKFKRIVEFIQQLKTGIIYCATRKNVEKVYTNLKKMGISCTAYHAGMTEDQRSKAQDRFIRNKSSVAIATNAFGMGIDRSDLRFIIHYDIPGSVEAYYQEVGRGGRDGEPARCELLFNYADVRTQKFFIEGANPTRETISGLHQALSHLCRNGPIELSISAIAEQVPGSQNEMAVGSALFLLERSGFIQRDYRQGSRTYTTSLVSPVKSMNQLEIDFERLDLKRDRDLARLQLMIDYAGHLRCRHGFILKYFEDPESSSQCTICDNCLAHHSSTSRLPTEEETITIQKALSCVARVNGRFGRARIAQTLLSSRSKEVMDAGLDRLSTYGLLSSFSSEYVWSLLDALIRVECISVSSGEYPTLSLTELGNDVMRRKKSISIPMPSAIVSKVSSRQDKKSRRASPIDQIEESAYPTELFEALRNWRRQTASGLGLKAYLIYPDKTLKEIARALPKTKDQLLEIRGIGPAKARQFGDETLEVIRNHSS